MKHSYFWIGSFLFIAIIALALYRQRTPQSIQTPASPEPPHVMTVRRDQQNTATRTLTLSGTVHASAESIIVAKASGTITALPLSLGASIAEGSLIARIDTTGATENAELATAAHTLTAAEATYAEARRVDHHADSHSSELAKDTARANRDSARALYAATQDRFILKSPLRGTVTALPRRIGDSVVPGTHIATISNGAPIVTFFVSDDERRALALHDDVTVVTHRGTSGIATITQIAPAADPESKRFRIDASCANDACRTIALGTSVTVQSTVTEQAPDGLFFVPLDAVSRGQNDSALFLAEGTIARRVPVTIHVIDGDRAIIRADIAQNAAIIVTNVRRLSDGDSIRL